MQYIALLLLIQALYLGGLRNSRSFLPQAAAAITLCYAVLNGTATPVGHQHFQSDELSRKGLVLNPYPLSEALSFFLAKIILKV